MVDQILFVVFVVGIIFIMMFFSVLHSLAKPKNPIRLTRKQASAALKKHEIWLNGWLLNESKYYDKIDPICTLFDCRCSKCPLSSMRRNCCNDGPKISERTLQIAFNRLSEKIKRKSESFRRSLSHCKVDKHD